jgi:hypothetical protein
MAYEFNGTTQRLSTASNPVGTLPVTMSCWFYPDTTNARVMVCLGNQLTGNNSRVLIYHNTDSKIYAFSENATGSNTQSASTNTFTTGTWHHAAGVFESTTSRTPYLNGTAGTTGTVSNSPNFAVIDRVLVGVQQWAASTASFFDGRIAEVGLWNAALTASEIASLAKGMTCDKVRPNALVFYAPLIRDLQDVRGGLTITNNNTATVANHPRVYA